MLDPRLHLSRKLVLALLAGLSVSVLIAGFFLNRRRRRYRAVSTSARGQPSSSLNRSFTFQEQSTPLADDRDLPVHEPYNNPPTRVLFSSEPCLSQSSSHENSDKDFVEATDLPLVPLKGGERPASPSGSGYSSDSFHSTIDELPPPLTISLHHSKELYHTGLQHAMQGQVLARTLRTEELCCSGDLDFLAKLYCVRLAFNELTGVAANRQYFQQMGRDLMSSFLASTGHDTTLFCERFDALVGVLGDEGGHKLAELELRERRVVAMNVYDVALDFVLMDAFSDLDHPPSTVLAVLQNTWITDGMKKSALSAAVWSLLKAKRSMLNNKDGFMGHFYLLSEVLTPVMAWGFLGTDLAMQQHCLQLKSTVTQFLQDVFSLDTVRYSSVSCLADDIINLARLTVHTF